MPPDFDLRSLARIAILALVPVALGALIVGPWLLVGFASAVTQRGHLILSGRHVAGRASHNANTPMGRSHG